MKTVYRFYKIPSEDALEATRFSKDLDISDKYPLYAFTNEKELRDEFCKIRDPNKFIEIKSKMTKAEYVNFANNNSNQRLIKYKYSHLCKYRTDRATPNIKDYEVVTTFNEKEFVDASGDINNVECWGIFPYIFKDKYVEALRTLEYLNLWKLYSNLLFYQELMDEQEVEDADYSAPSISFDELNTFVLTFGDTMRTE